MRYVKDKFTLFDWARANTPTLLLVVLLVLSFIIRYFGATLYSLSNDELSALARLQFDDILAVWQQGVKPDGHPALAQTLLYITTKIFGYSVLAVRLPFVVVSLGSIILLYSIGKQLYNAWVGLVAASLLALLSYSIDYSILARPYALGLFFTLLAYKGWLGYFWTKGKPLSSLILFGLGCLGAMYSHYFSFLQVVLLAIGGLFYSDYRTKTLSPKAFLPYIINGLLIIALFMPHIGFTLHQLGTGGVGGPNGWLGAPNKWFLVDYIKYAFNSYWWLVLSVGLVIAGMSNFQFTKTQTLQRFWLGLWWLLPIVIGYVYSKKVNPVLQYSVILFSFPFLLLLICSFIERANTLLILGLWALLLSTTVVGNGYLFKPRWGEFKGVVETIQSRKTYTLQKGYSQFTLGSANAGWYLDYYNKNKQQPLCNLYVTDFEEDLSPYINLIDTLTTDNVGIGWAGQHTPHELMCRMSQRFKYLSFYDLYKGGEYWEFSNVDKNNRMVIDTIYKYIHSIDTPLTLTQEYGPNVTLPSLLAATPGTMLVAEVQLTAPATSNVHLCASAQNNDTKDTPHWEARKIQHQFNPNQTTQTLYLCSYPNLWQGYRLTSQTLQVGIWNINKVPITITKMGVYLIKVNPQVY